MKMRLKLILVFFMLGLSTACTNTDVNRVTDNSNIEVDELNINIEHAGKTPDELYQHYVDGQINSWLDMGEFSSQEETEYYKNLIKQEVEDKVIPSGKMDMNLHSSNEKADFQYIVVKNEISDTVVDMAIIEGYIGLDEEITIPNEIEGYPVIGLAKEAFNGDHIIKKIQADFSSVQISIEDAFNNMSALTDISITGVKKIISCFNGCACLNSVSIGEGTELISDSFTNLENLERVFFPKTLKRISGVSFSYCDKLKNTIVIKM